MHTNAWYVGPTLPKLLPRFPLLWSAQSLCPQLALRDLLLSSDYTWLSALGLLPCPASGLIPLL